MAIDTGGGAPSRAERELIWRVSVTVKRGIPDTYEAPVAGLAAGLGR